MDRRLFLKNGFYGVSALIVGSSCSRAVRESFMSALEVPSLSFTITSAIKQMATHNDVNEALCNFWIFKEDHYPAECPGPVIVTNEGETINVTVTNELDEPHAFFIKGVVNSGPIAPGQTKALSFIAPTAGTYLYYDHLNAPVNRVMGLHGALIVMPRNLQKHSTPYTNPTVEVQRLFDDLGTNMDLFPGLAWGEGDPNTNTPAFRQYLWLLHQASPILFAEVANYPAGQDFPADVFVKAFTQDPFANTSRTGVFNRKPHFFTINGQSGHFSHHNPFITPFRRVGEPVVIRVLNAGIWTHSLHYHANHYAVLSLNNVVQDNLLAVDTWGLDELESMDILYTFRRPPDIPNVGGRGLSSDAPLIGLNGKPVWPPEEELALVFQPDRTQNLFVNMSPLCYPMHDHTETSQTSQGANYPIGMISGAFFTGDRNSPGFLNFPSYPAEFDVDPLKFTGMAAPFIPNPGPGHHGGSQGGQDQDDDQQTTNGSGGGHTTGGHSTGGHSTGGHSTGGHTTGGHLRSENAY